MGERMSFWVALGTVVVCGFATGIVMHALGVIFVAGTLVARGQTLVSTARPEDATSALATYALLAVIVEAMLIKLGVGALTRFTISFPRALGAGVLTGVLGVLPVAAVLARPVHSMVAPPGIEPGVLDAGPPALARGARAPRGPRRRPLRAARLARRCGTPTPAPRAAASRPQPATASSTASGMSKFA